MNDSTKPPDEPGNDQPEDATPHNKPPLGRITSITKPGYELFIPRDTPEHKWIFNALPNFDGFIVFGSPQEEQGWEALYASGMPIDMPLVNVVFSAGAYDQKYQNFAVVSRGVQVDRSMPDKGISANLYTLSRVIKGPDGEVARVGQIQAHIWFQALYVNGSSAFLAALFNKGHNRLLKYRGVGLNYHLRYNEGQDKSADTLLAHRFLLTNSLDVLAAAMNKRGPEMSKDEFHKQALDALPELISKGRTKLSQEILGKHFGLHRDTIRIYLKRDPGLYPALQSRFKELYRQK